MGRFDAVAMKIGPARVGQNNVTQAREKFLHQAIRCSLAKMRDLAEIGKTATFPCCVTLYLGKG
jgi:hypothetical protein